MPIGWISGDGHIDPDHGARVSRLDPLLPLFLRIHHLVCGMHQYPDPVSVGHPTHLVPAAKERKPRPETKRLFRHQSRDAVGIILEIPTFGPVLPPACDQVRDMAVFRRQRLPGFHTLVSDAFHRCLPHNGKGLKCH